MRANEVRAIQPLEREKAITPPEKLAVCYMNRSHDSVVGVPFSVWQELALWLWANPDGTECVSPSGLGLKAPDAIPLPIDVYLRKINGYDKHQVVVLSNAHPNRILWVYPKL